jgi:transcriptional regulator with PAS, ATPase and Fis domain
MQALGNSAGKYSRQRERQIIQMMIQRVEKAKDYCKNHHQLLTVAMEYLAKYDVRGNLIELSKLMKLLVSTSRKLT